MYQNILYMRLCSQKVATFHYFHFNHTHVLSIPSCSEHFGVLLPIFSYFFKCTLLLKWLIVPFKNTERASFKLWLLSTYMIYRFVVTRDPFIYIYIYIILYVRMLLGEMLMPLWKRSALPLVYNTSTLTPTAYRKHISIL